MFNDFIKRRKFNSMSLSDQVDAVLKDPYDIRFIEDPAKSVQLAAVRKWGDSIQHIKNPDRDVQFEAVHCSPEAVKYIENPGKDVQLEAVSASGSTIRFIKSPDKDVQLAAVQSNGISIQYIENPEKDVQLAAVRRSGVAVQYITDPGKDVQLEAVRNTGLALKYIKNPDKDLQLAAVRKDGKMIQYIGNPCRDAQIEAVRQDGSAIQYISNPDRAVVMETCRSFERDPVGTYAAMMNNITSLYALGNVHDGSLSLLAQDIEKNIEKIRRDYPEFGNTLEAAEDALEETLYKERGMIFLDTDQEGRPRGDVLFVGDSGMKNRERTRMEIQALCGGFTEHINAYFIKPDSAPGGSFSVVRIKEFDIPEKLGGMTCVQSGPETIMSGAGIKEIKAYVANFVTNGEPITPGSIDDISAVCAAVDRYASDIFKDAHKEQGNREQEGPADRG